MKLWNVCAILLWIALVNARIGYKDIIDDDKPDQGTHLTPDDFAEAHNFRETDIKPIISRVIGEEKAKKDPLETAGKFEGDIAGHNKGSIHNFIRKSNYMGRNAVRNRWQLWPNGEVPYMISSRYGSYSRKVIAKAMEQYHTKTCIRFKPRKRERNYVYIYPEEGCYSLVGRVGGRQPLSLDAGCIQVGTIIHELMHTVGFFHEQSRADRDDYIEIKWGNLITGASDQFESYSLRTIQHLGAKYDYGSIMHYGPYAFSKYPYRSSGKTIIPKKSGAEKMGQRVGFSKIDLYKVNKLYQCEMDEVEEGDGEDDDETTTDGDGSGEKRPTTPVKKPCEDKKWNCFLRPTFGRCSSTRARTQCPKSCGFCKDGVEGLGRRAGSRGTDTDDDDGEEDEGASSCRDVRAHCSDWKSKGYCRKYSSYMKRNCPVTCGMCRSTGGGTDSDRGTTGTRGSGRRTGGSTRGTGTGGSTRRSGTSGTEEESSSSTATTVTECKDKDSHCPDWTSSAKGYCRKYPSYMKKKCPKSCNFCQGSTGGAGGDTSAEEGGGGSGTNCRNENQKCTEYANMGYCTGVNEQVMKRYCKKACGLC